MNNAKSPPFAPVPVELIGGLYTEASPETQPLGSSPRVINCDFILGSGFQRPGKQSSFYFDDLFLLNIALFAESIDDAPNEQVWTNPIRATFNIMGTYATCVLFSPPNNFALGQRLTCLNFGFNIPAAQGVIGFEVLISGHQTSQLTGNEVTVKLLTPAADSPEFTVQLPASDGVTTVGTPTENWGLALTPAVLNNPNFGVQIQPSAVEVPNTGHTGGSIFDTGAEGDGSSSLVAVSATPSVPSDWAIIATAQDFASGGPIANVIACNNFSITSNVITLFAGLNILQNIGDTVTMSGWNTAGDTFINGVSLVLTGVSGVQATANFTHADYGSAGQGFAAGGGFEFVQGSGQQSIQAQVLAQASTINFLGAVTPGQSWSAVMALFGTVSGTPPVINQKAGGGGAFNNLTINFGSPTTAGRTIVVMLQVSSLFQGGATAIFTDDAGNIYTHVGSATDTHGHGTEVIMAYCQDALSAQHITIQLGGSIIVAGANFTALEISNLVSVAAFVPCEFDIYAVQIKVFLTPNPPQSFNYLKTFAQDAGEILNLALGSDGVFYQEDAVNNPFALDAVYTEVQPDSYAQSATVDDREFIAVSNDLNGTDIPLTYTPPNFDRLSQVGPGNPPTCSSSSAGSAIVNITQNPPVTLTVSPHAFLLVSDSPSDHGDFGTPATPGNVLTLEFPAAEAVPAYLSVGDNLFLSGFPTINGNRVNNDPTGALAPAFYTIASIGSPPPGQQSYAAITLTVNFTTFFAEMTPAGCVIQATQATLTTAEQVPNLEVGSQFSATGTGGAPPAGYDSSWTVLATPNASQLEITSTVLNGNVATYGYSLISGTNPASGEAITVTLTLNGNGIFNVTNAVISAASAGSFSIPLTGPNVPSAAETGAGLVFGTIFIFDAFAIIGTKTGGEVITVGVIAAGIRKCCYSFLTRNGFVTQPSPITTFDVVAGASNIVVSNLLPGPPNVIARIIHLTAANGDQFYNIPVPVSVTDNGVTVISSSTYLNDNVSTQATLSFADGVLLTADEIDIEGNNLFECGELGSCVMLVPFAQRLWAIGEQNKIQNLLNFSFDGGFLVVRSTGGTATGTYPAGWTVDPTNGGGVAVSASPIFGFAFQISNQTGIMQAIYGMITQDAFQDEFMVPIVFASTTYSVRVTVSVPTGPTTGNLVIDLYSPSIGKALGTFTLPLSEVGIGMAIFTGTLLTTVLAPVPNDLELRIYATNIQTGVIIVMDRFEPFPTEAPNLNNQVIGSYQNNFESFDRLTGPVLTNQQNQQPVVSAFELFSSFFITKTGSTIAINDNNTTEPADWNPPRTVSQAVGALGPNAVTTGIDAPNAGEEWAIIASKSGAFIYSGQQPIKISEEIQSVWNQINKAYAYKSWVVNDVANRRILFGVPLNELNAAGVSPVWLPPGMIANGTNPTSPNVVLMLNYKQLNTAGALADSVGIHRSYSGKMIASDIVRKWAIWTIEAPCAAFLTRDDTSAPLFLGNSENTGKIYQLVDGLGEDDGEPIFQRYLTAGFVPSETGQGLQIGVTRFTYEYMTLVIDGSGELVITLYPNTMSTPYSHDLLPNLTLPASTNGDVELPMNETGSRLFIEFSTDDVGAGFTLSRIIVAMTKDPWSPVRGVNS